MLCLFELKCTATVESLYTNIPHEGGIEAMEFFLRDPHHIKTLVLIALKY